MGQRPRGGRIMSEGRKNPWITKFWMVVWKSPSKLQDCCCFQSPTGSHADPAQVNSTWFVHTHFLWCCITPAKKVLYGQCCIGWAIPSFSLCWNVPIRLSENVVNPEGQSAIHSVMPDCERRYIITMCEDAGFGSVRRDRGWLAGVRAPYRWIADPNLIYQHLSSILSQKQVPQSELWWEDDDGLQRERRKMAGRLRKFELHGALCLGLISYGVLF